MPITSTLSNHFKHQRNAGNINMSSDVFKVILLASFTFDKDAHATLADVTASQLATNYGYTQNDEELDNVSLTENDTDDSGDVEWDDVVFTADGGSIGPFNAMIIYDDTTSDDTVMACVELGANHTITDGLSYLFKDIKFQAE